MCHVDVVPRDRNCDMVMTMSYVTIDVNNFNLIPIFVILSQFNSNFFKTVAISSLLDFYTKFNFI